MRHDLGYLKRLSMEIDILAREGLQLMTDPDRCTKLSDLCDYFLYLTLDALADEGVARELVESFEWLVGKSITHANFFFALGQLLSCRHCIARLPGEKISREAFERSFRRTAAQLGL